MRLRVEQAVYGCFPFWARGYALLGQSPGCDPSWVRAFVDACTSYGQRPRKAPAGGLFALPLRNGPWLVVGVSDQGADDRGRPGALAFHALFVSRRDYRRIGAAPFPLDAHLRWSWTADDAHLPTLDLSVDPFPLRTVTRRANLDPRAASVAHVLSCGRRVPFAAPAPDFDLAADVWSLLPIRQRKRRSLATWAFGNDLALDLVAMPIVPALDPGRDADIDQLPSLPTRPPRVAWPPPLLVGATGLLALLALGWALLR